MFAILGQEGITSKVLLVVGALFFGFLFDNLHESKC